MTPITDDDDRVGLLLITDSVHFHSLQVYKQQRLQPDESHSVILHISDSNRLLTDTVSDIMMIYPPLRSWNATKYVASWLKSGRYGALDKATGVCRKTEEPPTSTLLFA